MDQSELTMHGFVVSTEGVAMRLGIGFKLPRSDTLHESNLLGSFCCDASHATGDVERSPGVTLDFYEFEV